MPQQSPNLKLPYLMAAQAQKHVTHNEAIRMLDAFVQLSVKDRALAAPPGSPVDGHRYIVAASPTGAWAGQALKIAAWQDGAWEFFTPSEGWLAWIENEDSLFAWDGAAWIATGASVNPAFGGKVGVNTTADNTNRLAVKSDATLFSHDDVSPGSGDMRQVLNKAATARTVSQLYQTGFSGRAEIGLTGDDNLHVKVSADGSTWFEAININRTNGRVSLPLSASVSGANNLLQLTSGGFIHANVTGIQRLPSTTIADDAVLLYDPPDFSTVFGAVVVFKTTTNTQPHGLLWVRAATTPVVAPILITGGVTPGYYNTALTGTTGTDGRINFGVDDTGKFYIENRVGFAITVSAWMHI